MVRVRARTWARRLATALAAVVDAALSSRLWWARSSLSTRPIAVIGSVSTSFFTPHVALAGLAGHRRLAPQARRLGGRRAAAIVLWLAILATAGAAVPLVELVRMAHQVRRTDFLVGAPSGDRRPDRNLRRIKRSLFATVDGKRLYLDIYLPASAVRGSPSDTSAPAVMIHGGGFSLGRAQRRNPVGPLACRARLHRL